jgi:hypothetical protein
MCYLTETCPSRHPPTHPPTPPHTHAHTPQVGGGGIRAAAGGSLRAPMTMAEVLEVLLAKARVEAEDAQASRGREDLGGKRAFKVVVLRDGCLASHIISPPLPGLPLPVAACSACCWRASTGWRVCFCCKDRQRRRYARTGKLWPQVGGLLRCFKSSGACLLARPSWFLLRLALADLWAVATAVVAVACCCGAGLRRELPAKSSPLPILTAECSGAE